MTALSIDGENVFEGETMESKYWRSPTIGFLSAMGSARWSGNVKVSEVPDGAK